LCVVEREAVTRSVIDGREDGLEVQGHFRVVPLYWDGDRGEWIANGPCVALGARPRVATADDCKVVA
jgi:hypothetical protein